MLKSLVYLVCHLALVPITLANVEKVIFLGPEPVPIPQTPPTIPDLGLHTLTPANASVRTALARASPAEFHAGGPAAARSTWLLLDDLVEGQRYELRVCWSAVEPTNFKLAVHELDEVWSTPDLIQSFAAYAYQHLDEDGAPPRRPAAATDGASGERRASVLLLEVRAAADYFTDDKALMDSPPTVLVDLILDPFLFNLVPVSLLPTAGYLVLLAVVSWFASSYISAKLTSMSRPEQVSATKKTT